VRSAVNYKKDVKSKLKKAEKMKRKEKKRKEQRCTISTMKAQTSLKKNLKKRKLSFRLIVTQYICRGKMTD